MRVLVCLCLYPQMTVNHWLLHWGMSIGIADTVADEETMKAINAIITKAKDDVGRIISQYQAEQLEQQPGRTMQVGASQALVFRACCYQHRLGLGKGCCFDALHSCSVFASPLSRLVRSCGRCYM